MDSELGQSLTKVAQEELEGDLDQAKQLLATTDPAKTDEQNIKEITQKVLDTIGPDEGAILTRVEKFWQSFYFIEYTNITRKLNEELRCQFY